MRCYAFAQIDALADVERHRIEPVEAIDARRLRDRVQRVCGKVRRKARRPKNPGDRGVDFVGSWRSRYSACTNSHRIARVAECSMAFTRGQAVTLDETGQGCAARMSVNKRRDSLTVHSTRAVNGLAQPPEFVL